MEFKKINENSEPSVPTIKLSKNDWHFKYQMYLWMLKDPYQLMNFNNLCPYFWILIGSFLVTPFLLPISFVVNSYKYLSKKIYDKWIYPRRKRKAEEWYNSLDDQEVYKIFDLKNDYNVYNYLKYLELNWREELVKKWLKENKKIKDVNIDRYYNWSDEFKQWFYEQEQIYLETQEEKNNELSNFQKINYVVSKPWNSLDNSFTKLFNKIHISFNLNSIIKWIKRITGIIITLVIGYLTYYIVLAENVILGVLFDLFIDLFKVIKTNPIIIFSFVGGVLIAILFIQLIYHWQIISDWNKRHYNILKYIEVPIIFIVGNIYQLIKRIVILLLNSSKGIWGIFAEYFGAAYTDYCPGIEWEEDKED